MKFPFLFKNVFTTALDHSGHTDVSPFSNTAIVYGGPEATFSDFTYC